MIKLDCLCPVCGYELDEPPWKPCKSLFQPTHQICSVCGIQFGYQDLKNHYDYPGRRYTYKAWRQKWMTEGKTWKHVFCKPANWQVEEQLENLRLLEEAFEKKVKTTLNNLRCDQKKECSSGRMIGWVEDKRLNYRYKKPFRENYKLIYVYDPNSGERGAEFFPATDVRYFREWVCKEQIGTQPIAKLDRPLVQACVKEMIDKGLIPQDEFVTRIGVKPEVFQPFVDSMDVELNQDLAFGIHHCLNEVCYGLWFYVRQYQYLKVLYKWEECFQINRTEMRAVFERWKVRS